MGTLMGRLMVHELRQASGLLSSNELADNFEVPPQDCESPFLFKQDLPSDEARGVWRKLETRLKSILGNADYKAWLAPLVLTSAGANNVYFVAGNAYARTRIRTEYLHRLQAVWNDFDKSSRRLIVDIEPFSKVPTTHSEIGSPDLEAQYPTISKFSNDQSGSNLIIGDFEASESSLNLRTFESFEEGASNKIAIALAKRMANDASNGEILLLHGLNGVGKTHLLAAIANQSLSTQPKRKVVSLTAQRFLNLFQAALRDKDTGPFKEGLRAADILIIDDIQLICGKIATQEEFFQTILELLSRGKNIVCSADVPPEGLVGLTPRMTGILLGGFNIRIGEPDFALRRKIAERKVAEFAALRPDFAPSPQALDIIAARVIGTGRNIEGAVKQIFAASSLIGQEATMEVILEALGDRMPTPTKSIPVDVIKKRVALHFDISIEDLIGTRRHISVARPRQIVMYFCKKFTKRSFPDIASRMGGRDHTTVMHAVKRIEQLADADGNFAAQLQIIANKILT